MLARRLTNVLNPTCQVKDYRNASV